MNTKRFYEHEAVDSDECGFYVDLCDLCHDSLMQGASVQSTDIPKDHTISDVWSWTIGHDCHACGNEEAE